MKKQILTFIIGVLVGGILSTTVLLIVKPSKGNMPDFDRSNFPSRQRSNTDDSEKLDEEVKTEESN